MVFPRSRLSLRALFEAGKDITPRTIAAELLASDAVSPDERLELESEVSLALYALSAIPLLRSDRQGGTCPKCAGFTPFSNTRFCEQFLAHKPRLTCPECRRSSARRTWRWASAYCLVSPEVQALPGYLDTFPLGYWVPIPDHGSRWIATADEFWLAVEDAAVWYLGLTAAQLEAALEGTDEADDLPRRIGSAVSDLLCPGSVRDYAALLLIFEGLWDTFYAKAEIALEGMGGCIARAEGSTQTGAEASLIAKAGRLLARCG